MEVQNLSEQQVSAALASRFPFPNQQFSYICTFCARVHFPSVAFSHRRLSHHPLPGQLRVTPARPSRCCFFQWIQGDENPATEHTFANRAGVTAVIKNNNKNLK